MANLTNILEQHSSVEASLAKRMADFEEHLKAAKDEVSLTKLSTDFAIFKEQVWGILQLLKQQINELGKSIDLVEMRHRRKFLFIHGIPENSSQSNINALSDLLRSKFGLKDVAEADFKSLSRFGKQSEGKTRPLLIHFANLQLKSLLWKRKACLKGTTIVISEFLTRRRQDLLTIARKQLGIKNCWTQNGDIMVKSGNGMIHRIHDINDLAYISSSTEKTTDNKQHESCSHTTVPAVTTQKRSARTRK